MSSSERGSLTIWKLEESVVPLSMPLRGPMNGVTSPGEPRGCKRQSYILQEQAPGKAAGVPSGSLAFLQNWSCKSGVPQQLQPY